MVLSTRFYPLIKKALKCPTAGQMPPFHTETSRVLKFNPSRCSFSSRLFPTMSNECYKVSMITTGIDGFTCSARLGHIPRQKKNKFYELKQIIKNSSGSNCTNRNGIIE